MVKIAGTFAVAGCLIAGLTAGPPAHADEGLDMAKRNHCTACHRVDRKLIGPAYLDVARKYAGDVAAEARLDTKVKLGGTGVWGNIPMPSNDQVTEADVKSLVSWILQLKATADPLAPSAASPVADASADQKN